MKYRRSLLLLPALFIFFFIEPLSAQVNSMGNPLMVSYDYSQTGGSEWNYSIIKDDRGIVYLGNEIKGVLEFDGINWNSIRINNNPVIYAIDKDLNGILYACGPYEFGYIAPQKGGKLSYVSLSSRLDSTDKAELEEVWDIEYFKENIYFVSGKTVYKYNYQTDILGKLKSADNIFKLQRIFSLNDRLLIADNREGLMEMTRDSLELLPGGEAFGRDYCFAVLPYDSTWCLVGTYYNGLCLYNPNTGEIKWDFVSDDINKELQASQIYNGSVLSDGNFAIGTMGAGVYIISREGEIISRYSNEALGLHDDQIYSVYHDGLPSFSSQLWMSVVEKIYHISYNLPVRYFDERNNITYPIRVICEFNDNVYVCGDKGVAKMSTIDNKLMFEELEGISSQTFSIIHFKAGDNRNYLLAATFDGLFIIDEHEKVSKFIDILANPSEGISAGFISSLKQSEFQNGVFYLGLNGKIRVIQYDRGKWRYSSTIQGFPGRVNNVVEESPDKLWVNTINQNKLLTVDISNSDTAIVAEYNGDELDGSEVKSVEKIDGFITIVTNSSILKYNANHAKFEVEEKYHLDTNSSLQYEDIASLGEYGVLISASDYRNFDYIVKPDGSKIVDVFYLLPKSYTAGLMVKENMLWLPKQQEIYLLDLDRIGNFDYTNDVLIRKVTIGGDSILFNGAFYEESSGRVSRLLKHQPKTQIPKINHSLNDITFNWSSNNYLADDSIAYRFMIENFDKDWTKWESVNYKDYTNLQHGKYKFKIQAKGLTRDISQETVYEFEILPAWYQSVIAMIVYAILILMVVVVIIKIYTRRLINENVRLEGIVAARTKEVVRQKEELEASIHYASRIQRAILPSEQALVDNVEEYFILFKPRDIVSGDFYWVSQKGSRLYIVAADCTGHGVPGAFMSIFGISFLDEIVNKADNTETDKILNALRKHVTDSLKQMEEGIEETKDGMDLAILVVNYEDNEIQFSGAYNPCWIVRELTREEKRQISEE